MWPSQAVADWVVALTQLIEPHHDAYIQGTHESAVLLAQTDRLIADGEATESDVAERKDVLWGALAFSGHMQVRAMEARRQARLRELVEH